MDKEEKMEFLRLGISIVAMIFMIVTLELQIVAFEPVRHVIMCIIIIALTNVIITLDIHLKYSKAMILMHIGWYILWFSNLVINLFKF